MSGRNETGRQRDIMGEIEDVNTLMDRIAATYESIDRIDQTIVICEEEIIDTKSLSLMSLPSTKDFFENI